MIKPAVVDTDGHIFEPTDLWERYLILSWRVFHKPDLERLDTRSTNFHHNWLKVVSICWGTWLRTKRWTGAWSR